MSRDCQNYNNQSFLEDFEKVNWTEVFEVNQNNFKLNFEKYLNAMRTFHPSLKMLIKKTKKVSTNPWITKE